MRQAESGPTQKHRQLLKQIAHPPDDQDSRELYLDEITALARMRLVRFDPEGQLRLTDKGLAALPPQ